MRWSFLFGGSWHFLWQKRVLGPVCQHHTLVLLKCSLLWLCCFPRGYQTLLGAAAFFTPPGDGGPDPSLLDLIRFYSARPSGKSTASGNC